MVRDGVDDHAHAMLVSDVAHLLEFILGTEDVVADRRVDRLVDVVPVEVPVAFTELAVVLDGGHVVDLDRGIAGLRDLLHVFLDRLERPHERVERGAVTHVLRQAVLVACGLERGIANGIGIAVTQRSRGCGLHCACGKAQTAKQRCCGDESRDGLPTKTFEAT